MRENERIYVEETMNDNEDMWSNEEMKILRKWENN